MRILAWILGILIGLSALFGIVQTAASERVEVVELHTLDGSGEMETTRLWVMDHDGYQYLRVGGDGSGWYSRIRANDTVQVTRNDETKTYTTVDRPDKSELINKLMSEKYTWGDDFFATMFGGREGSIPVELHEVMGQ